MQEKKKKIGGLRKTSGEDEEKHANGFLIKNCKMTHDQSKQPCETPPTSSEEYLAERHHTTERTFQNEIKFVSDLQRLINVLTFTRCVALHI